MQMEGVRQVMVALWSNYLLLLPLLLLFWFYFSTFTSNLVFIEFYNKSLLYDKYNGFECFKEIFSVKLEEEITSSNDDSLIFFSNIRDFLFSFF